MVLLPNVFQPNEVSASEFEPIADGWYEAEIIKSELKTTNAGDGKYLAFTFKIVEGEHEGRYMFTNLNIVNKNDTAVKIAQQDLKKICLACGRDEDEELEDTLDLHNISMAIKTVIKPETAQWPAKNELKDFKSIDDSPL